MNSIVFDQIIQLNKDFYDEIAEHFSNTRQYPWKGWEIVLKEVEKRYSKEKKITIADIACGNARFYKYLKSNLPDWEIIYCGFDSNNYLLDQARKEFPENKYFKIWNIDVITNLSKIDVEFDLVVAFGITHHIPSQEYRLKWFENLSRLVNQNGLLVYTIWNYSQDDRFITACRSVSTVKYHIKENDLDEGDYFVGWDKKAEIYRYYHDYNVNELEKISKRIHKTITQKDLFVTKSDGKSGHLNTYYLYG